MTMMYLPAPEPYTGPDWCRTCQGKGITGQQVDYSTQDACIAVDVICGSCGGCGHDDTHEGCTDDQHGDLYEWTPDENDETEVCQSCNGRGWWAAEGYPDPVRDESGQLLMTFEDRVVYLRMPCGCSESKMVALVREPAPAPLSLAESLVSAVVQRSGLWDSLAVSSTLGPLPGGTVLWCRRDGCTWQHQSISHVDLSRLIILGHSHIVQVHAAEVLTYDIDIDIDVYPGREFGTGRGPGPVDRSDGQASTRAGDSAAEPIHHPGGHE